VAHLNSWEIIFSSELSKKNLHQSQPPKQKFIGRAYGSTDRRVAPTRQSRQHVRPLDWNGGGANFQFGEEARCAIASDTTGRVPPTAATARLEYAAPPLPFVGGSRGRQQTCASGSRAGACSRTLAGRSLSARGVNNKDCGYICARAYLFDSTPPSDVPSSFRLQKGTPPSSSIAQCGRQRTEGVVELAAAGDEKRRQEQGDAARGDGDEREGHSGRR
jgi:hypothetical protein